jgi:predicted secreted hydrolase
MKAKRANEKSAIRSSTRRRVLTFFASLTATCGGARSASGATGKPAPSLAAYPPVMPGDRMRFPEDEGAHPAFRTEWWYVTGWLEPEREAPIGFQITFFRTRPETDDRNPSAFTPRQIFVAHAALSDASHGRLVHDQKIAREAFGLAGAKADRTHVWIDDWALTQDGGTYRITAPARDFVLDINCTAGQPPLEQGEQGYSRKGPDPRSASYYYSLPHLRVAGALTRRRTRSAVTGTAWLDHEWSSSYMDPEASGWDWLGINLDDGSALMLFQMRARAGGKFWAGGAHRSAMGVRRSFAPAEVQMTPIRWWRSARTGTNYPVAWRVQAGGLNIELQPLMDDQEHDTRLSVGTIYWEGAVSATIAGRSVGRGYLELTGYWRPMRL